jgi:hypothetical protein
MGMFREQVKESNTAKSFSICTGIKKKRQGLPCRLY